MPTENDRRTSRLAGLPRRVGMISEAGLDEVRRTSRQSREVAPRVGLRSGSTLEINNHISPADIEGRE